MKLIIDIPDTLYESIQACKNIEDTDEVTVDKVLIKAVENGASLPKGHGKLIDVGQCDRKLFYQQCGGADSLITVKSAFDMLMSLPTIIEADTEGEEV